VKAIPYTLRKRKPAGTWEAFAPTGEACGPPTTRDDAIGVIGRHAAKALGGAVRVDVEKEDAGAHYTFADVYAVVARLATAEELQSFEPVEGRPLRVIVTGSRHWTDYDTIHSRLAQFPRGTVIVHGANGVKKGRKARPEKSTDALADWAARELGFEVEQHEADWDRYGRDAGPIRNGEMFDAGPCDMVVAFPLPGSRGTWDCVNRAKKRGIPVEVIR
jgi:hypothetical protein